MGRVAPPWWDDAPTFIVCGGPSLKGRSLEGLADRGHVLAVNDAVFHCRSRAFFSMDRRWIEDRLEDVLRIRDMCDEAYVAKDPRTTYPDLRGVTYLDLVQSYGYSTDPTSIVNGCNSGYGALNLALLKGAREIYLLGLDMREIGRGELWHWFDEEPAPPERCRNTIYYERWARRFSEIAISAPSDVRIYNANPGSAVRCFEFKSYEELRL